MRLWTISRRRWCTQRREAFNEVDAVVQINGIFSKQIWRILHVLTDGGAVLRPRESFGIAFTGRWSPLSKKSRFVV